MIDLPNAAREGRVKRPWEVWRNAYLVGIAAGVATAVIGIGAVVQFNAGVVAMWLFAACAGLTAVLVAYHRVMGTRISYWKRLDQSVSHFDQHWRPRMPKVTETHLGVVIEFSPPPALATESLDKALAGFAQVCGLRLVGCSVIHPSGFGRRVLGRVGLRVEMAR